MQGLQSFVSFLCAQHKCDPTVTAALVWLHSSLATPAVAWWPPQSAVGTLFHSAVTLEQLQSEDVMNQNPSSAAERRCRNTVPLLISFVCSKCCISLERFGVSSWRCWAVPFGYQIPQKSFRNIFFSGCHRTSTLKLGSKATVPWSVPRKFFLFLTLSNSNPPVSCAV